MDKLSALSRGTQIMLGAGVLLLIVSFFKWWSVDVGPISVGQNAWHGWGLIMGLALLVLLAWLVARLAGVNLNLPISETMIAAVLAAIVLLFALLENLIDDYSTFMSYIGVLLAAAVAVGAWLELQAAGGIDTLRTEMDTMRTRPAGDTTVAGGAAAAGGATATPVDPTPDPTPAPTPPPPPPAPAQPSPPPSDPPTSTGGSSTGGSSTGP